jgi:chromatin assembly factor 1 subunit B
MKANPLLIAWHNDNAPIYSVHFDPNGKGRLATAGKYVFNHILASLLVFANTSRFR